MTVHKADIEEAREVASLVQAQREALGVVYLSRIATALEKMAEAEPVCEHYLLDEHKHEHAMMETGVPLAAPMCGPGCPQLVTYEHTPDACFRPVARGGDKD